MSGPFTCAKFSCTRRRRGAPSGAEQVFCRRQNLGEGQIQFARAKEKTGSPGGRADGGGTSRRRLPSSWASKQQTMMKGRTWNVRPFHMCEVLLHPPEAGRAEWRGTSVLPQAKPWRRANSVCPSKRKNGVPGRRSRRGRNFAEEIAKQLGK